MALIGFALAEPMNARECWRFEPGRTGARVESRAHVSTAMARQIRGRLCRRQDERILHRCTSWWIQERQRPRHRWAEAMVGWRKSTKSSGLAGFRRRRRQGRNRERSRCAAALATLPVELLAFNAAILQREDTLSCELCLGQGGLCGRRSGRRPNAAESECMRSRAGAWVSIGGAWCSQQRVGWWLIMAHKYDGEHGHGRHATTKEHRAAQHVAGRRNLVRFQGFTRIVLDDVPLKHHLSML